MFSGILPVWGAGWASWYTWPATGSVLEACQPPSTITTGQFKPSVSMWYQESLTKARSVCLPQRKQTPERRNLCSQSHLAHRRCDPGQRWLLCHGEPHSSLGQWLLFQIFSFLSTNASLVGGSDPRGSDGSHPEVHGEGLSSCLVWEVRDEGQTRRYQQVWHCGRSS